MQTCARGGLSAPRIVQEAPDRDTNLGLVQCRIGSLGNPKPCVGTVPEESFCSQLLIWITLNNLARTTALFVNPKRSYNQA
jgi:hypothetical protein